MTFADDAVPQTLPHPDQTELFDRGHNGGPTIDDGEGLDSQKVRAGFVAINREIRNHWLVGFGQKPPKAMDTAKPQYAKSEAWIDLIMECQYRAGFVNNNGRKMELKPGQLLGAVSWLADRWNWTPKAVRYFLDQLEDEGMISRTSEEQKAQETKTLPTSDQARPKRGSKKGKFASVLTVCKYSLYQLGACDDGQVEGQSNGKSGATKGQVKGNNIKKEQRNKETKKQTGPSVHDVRWAHDRWNSMAEKADLPQAPKLTDDLSKTIRARLRENGKDGWEKALVHVFNSRFLRGQTDEGFKASLPWFAGPKNFTKIISGTYGNGAHAHQASGMSEAERQQRLRQIMAT